MGMIVNPFDDARYPDVEELCECFLCGRPVDQKDPLRGSYEEEPAGPRLYIHLPCLNGRDTYAVSVDYHKAVDDMATHSRNPYG